MAGISAVIIGGTDAYHPISRQGRRPKKWRQVPSAFYVVLAREELVDGRMVLQGAEQKEQDQRTACRDTLTPNPSPIQELEQVHPTNMETQARIHVIELGDLDRERMMIKDRRK